MPDAPAPIPVLSSTTMRLDPAPTVPPLARRRAARCIAVERPWMPAPIITQRALGGRVGMVGPECFVDFRVYRFRARGDSIDPGLRGPKLPACLRRLPE